MMTDSSRTCECRRPEPRYQRGVHQDVGTGSLASTFARVPAAAARFALGEMADELLLASTRVQPTRLLESDYEFRQVALEDTLRDLLGRVE